VLTQALPHEVTRYAQGALVVTPKVPVTTDSAPLSQLTGSPLLGSLAPAYLTSKLVFVLPLVGSLAPANCHQ
jgi:hypothetical protein